MDDELRALAANVRRMRESHGLSLAGLASRTGIAKATLFKIEARRTNPTLETLLLLASALSVSVADLLSSDGDAQVEVVRRGEGQAVPDSVVGARLINSVMVGSTLVEIYELTIPPGESEVSVSHGVGARDHVVVRGGRLRAGPLEAEVELGPGDYATFPSDRTHRWTALGDRPARVWVLHTFPRALVAPAS
jgi:transcriptional regulator with XRE-family HTH domain